MNHIQGTVWSITADPAASGAAASGFGAGYGEWGSGGGTASYHDDLQLIGNAYWSDNPSGNGTSRQEDYYHYSNHFDSLVDTLYASGGASATEDQITNTETHWSSSSPYPSITYSFSGGGSASASKSGYKIGTPDSSWNWNAHLSWSPSGDASQAIASGNWTATAGSHTGTPHSSGSGGGSETWSYISGIFGGDSNTTTYDAPGPAPGRNLWSLVSCIPSLTGGGDGLNAPGVWWNTSPDEYSKYPYLLRHLQPAIADGNWCAGVLNITYPTLPSDLLASESGVLTEETIADTVRAEFIGQSPVSGLSGMSFIADTGYGGAFSYGTIVTPPQTVLATGNTVAVTNTFTSETILGADGVFTSDNVAAAIPVTHNLTADTYTLGKVRRNQLAPAGGGTSATPTPTLTIDDFKYDGPMPKVDPVTNEVVPVCFAAGTPIMMADGTAKPIERIKDDDGVLSVSEKTPDGPITVGKVVEVIRNEPTPLVAVEIGGRTIHATARHPFYVLGRGFIPAEELAPGDRLRSASGVPLTVASVASAGRAERVYNFQVGGLHTYFVGDSAATAVLVHNDECGTATGTWLDLFSPFFHFSNDPDAGDPLRMQSDNPYAPGFIAQSPIVRGLDVVETVAEGELVGATAFVGGVGLTEVPFIGAGLLAAGIGESAGSRIYDHETAAEVFFGTTWDVTGMSVIYRAKTGRDFFTQRPAPVSTNEVMFGVGLFAGAAGAGALDNAFPLPRRAPVSPSVVRPYLPSSQLIPVEDVLRVPGDGLLPRRQFIPIERIGRGGGENAAPRPGALSLRNTCFVRGTPVLAPTGEKAIEDFKPGDEILSRPDDCPDARVRTSVVEKVFELSAETVELRIGEQVITTTAKHPFYVRDKGWTAAMELQPGDLLLGQDGQATAVESVSPTHRVETVYNLRVALDHTYFVGRATWGFSIWAHNDYIVVKAGNKFRVINTETKEVVGEFTEPDKAIQLADKDAAAANGGQTSPLLEQYLREKGGRWGGTDTRQLNDLWATMLESKGFEVIGGAGRDSEEWFRGLDGGTKGGTFVDITATNGVIKIRVQTVTTLADGITLTSGEAAAAARIRAKFPNDILILVSKQTGKVIP